MSLPSSISSPATGPNPLRQSLVPVKSDTLRFTPQEYKEAISFHAKQTTRQSPYPGQNFEDLDAFLQRPSTSSRISFGHQSKLPSSSVGTLYTFSTSTNVQTNVQTNTTENTTANGTANDGSTTISRKMDLSSVKQLDEQLLSIAPAHKTSYLLFLAGYLSSEWLTTVGSLCSVDPEHYQRHLRYLARQPYFSVPPLPSAAENIITLRFVTLGFRHPTGSSQRHIDRLRSDGIKDMDTYFHNLKRNRETQVKIGDSIVRRYSVHDERYFSIEQEISISINRIGRNWIALIWLDAGNDLSESLHGPWLTEDSSIEPSRMSRWKEVFLPTIRHRPRLALRSKRYALPPEEQYHSGHLPQVAALLRKDYGKYLDTKLIQIDPFYALHEIFSFSAASELQYLNLIDEKLGPETGWAILDEEIPSLSNLLYNREVLHTHIQQLKENIETIKCRGCNQWPRALTNSDLGRKADEAANILLRDFEYLLTKAENLSKRCDAGMAVVMNNANLAESRRAIAQASRVSKLTLLAFFYVPLSFTSSFFGMNFAQFGTSSTLGIWLWFAVSAPVLVLSFIFYQWDVPGFIKRSLIYYKMKRWFYRVW